MNDRTVAPARGNGRPRDPGIARAILAATLDALEDEGYGQLSIEAIARAAGTTKPALYRRWPDRRQLVLDALASRLGELAAPETDCTLCDLADGLKLFVGVFKRLAPGTLAALLSECADPELHAAFMRALFHPPRAAVAEVLERAVARGDLRPELDRELLLDLSGSLVHYRLLFGHAPVTDDQIDDAVHLLLRGVAVDYERLVEISRHKIGDPEMHAHHTG